MPIVVKIQMLLVVGVGLMAGLGYLVFKLGA